MADPNLSKYEQFLQDSKNQGESVYFNSDDDIKKIESMNEISLEVKRDYEEKDRNSQVYASKIILK